MSWRKDRYDSQDKGSTHQMIDPTNRERIGQQLPFSSQFCPEPRLHLAVVMGWSRGVFHGQFPPMHAFIKVTLHDMPGTWRPQVGQVALFGGADPAPGRRLSHWPRVAGALARVV